MDSGTPLNWVFQMMKNFCNMVGFPIMKHEAQFLALFHLLERECLKVIDGGEPKRSVNPGSRGLRELKGLISNINYNGVSSRRSIRKGWEVFSKHIRFEVGVGDRVKFWTDQWCGDLPLHLSFSVVYGIAINREPSVASSLERLGTEARRSWKVLLLRNPNDWSRVLWMISFIPWVLIYLCLSKEMYDLEAVKEGGF